MEEMSLGQVLVAAVFAALVTLNLTACGVTAGGMTAGTTSFLKEVNEGNTPRKKRVEVMEQHTKADREQLGALINRRY